MQVMQVQVEFSGENYNSRVSKTSKRLGVKSEVLLERTERRITPNSDRESPGDA